MTEFNKKKIVAVTNITEAEFFVPVAAFNINYDIINLNDWVNGQITSSHDFVEKILNSCNIPYEQYKNKELQFLPIPNEDNQVALWIDDVGFLFLVLTYEMTPNPIIELLI